MTQRSGEQVHRSATFRALEFYGTRLRHRGQWRVHAGLQNLLRANIDRDFEVTRAGLKWVLNPADYVHRNLFWMGERDRWDLHHIKLRLKPGAVICDIGSNFGYYALTLASFLNRDARVFAFEPNPLTRARLERNVLLNDLSDAISVCDVALSDCPGQMFMTSRADNSGAVHLAGEGEFAVHLDTLDAFSASRNLRRLDFVKIDVEGFESQVIRGGMKCLQEFRPMLLVELMPLQLERAGSSAAELVELLRILDYSIYTPDRSRLKPLNRLPVGDELVNVFCVHEDMKGAIA